MERFLLKIEHKFAKLRVGEMPSTNRRSTSLETPSWKTQPNWLRQLLPELIPRNTFAVSGMTVIHSIPRRWEARGQGGSRFRSRPESTTLQSFRKIAIML